METIKNLKLKAANGEALSTITLLVINAEDQSITNTKGANLLIFHIID